MNGAEIRDVDRRLRDVVTNHDLDWVLDQVDEEIRVGKLTQKKVTTYKEDEDRNSFSDQSFKPVSKAMLTASIEYSDQEKLLLLVDAIEQAVVNTTIMADETVSHLAGLREDRGRPEVKFMPEDAEEAPSVSLTEISVRRRSATRLAELLNEIRDKIRG